MTLAARGGRNRNGNGEDLLAHPGYPMSPGLKTGATMLLLAVWLPVAWHLTLVATADGLALTAIRTTAQALRTTRPITGLTEVDPAITPPGTVTVLVVWAVLLLGGFGLLLWQAARAATRGSRRRTQRGLATSRRPAADPVGDGVVFALDEGRPVRSRVEDSALVVAPNRSGKTTGLAAGLVVDAPGPVLATSTKADLVRLSAGARRSTGLILVFDPDQVMRWPDRARWDVVAGCGDVREATVRAKAMVTAKPLDGTRNGNFFAESAEIVLRCLLHAAALDAQTMREVLSWARDFDDEEPYAILRTHPDAAPGWDKDLAKYARGAAPETVSSLEMSLGLALKPLADPAVLDLVCPAPPGEDPGLVIDPAAFVASTDTLYVLAEGGSDTSSAPLATALVASVDRAARKASQYTATGRLPVPLTFVLDEAANVAPIPGLPALMTDGGGRGISVWTMVQTFSQLRARWGRDGADTLWGAGTIKVVLGGLSEVEDLDRLSRLVGERRVLRESDTEGDRDTTSWSTERERIMPPEAIRALPVGQALLFYRAQPATVVSLRFHRDRPDAEVFDRSQRWSLDQEGHGPS
ncbi:type IV secretory system conjugative DNA transfer family protein [Jannaschia sp. R86511]|uniref:type IV secretory system conjugative DNA transfer family protein n=1 Tax=Jannaschia sp. R86511 TaxID=3093853 RepID=UPI0036D30858